MGSCGGGSGGGGGLHQCKWRISCQVIFCIADRTIGGSPGARVSELPRQAQRKMRPWPLCFLAFASLSSTNAV